MKYNKPELEIVKIEFSEIASDASEWLEENETDDTSLTAFLVMSV